MRASLSIVGECGADAETEAEDRRFSDTANDARDNTVGVRGGGGLGSYGMMGEERGGEPDRVGIDLAEDSEVCRCAAASEEERLLTFISCHSLLPTGMGTVPGGKGTNVCAT